MRKMGWMEAQKAALEEMAEIDIEVGKVMKEMPDIAPDDIFHDIVVGRLHGLPVEVANEVRRMTGVEA